MKVNRNILTVIEKIKTIVNLKEITSERIHLKECDFNLDRLHYMLTIKQIDLRFLTVKKIKIFFNFLTF